jgi:hypothetical protein
MAGFKEQKNGEVQEIHMMARSTGGKGSEIQIAKFKKIQIARLEKFRWSIF